MQESDKLRADRLEALLAEATRQRISDAAKHAEEVAALVMRMDAEVAIRVKAEQDRADKERARADELELSLFTKDENEANITADLETQVFELSMQLAELEAGDSKMLSMVSPPKVNIGGHQPALYTPSALQSEGGVVKPGEMISQSPAATSSPYPAELTGYSNSNTSSADGDGVPPPSAAIAAAIMGTVAAMAAERGERPATYLTVKRVIVTEFGADAFRACKAEIEKVLVVTDQERKMAATPSPPPMLQLGGDVAAGSESDDDSSSTGMVERIQTIDIDDLQQLDGRSAALDDHDGPRDECDRNPEVSAVTSRSGIRGEKSTTVSIEVVNPVQPTLTPVTQLSSPHSGMSGSPSMRRRRELRKKEQGIAAANAASGATSLSLPVAPAGDGSAVVSPPGLSAVIREPRPTPFAKLVKGCTQGGIDRPDVWSKLWSSSAAATSTVKMLLPAPYRTSMSIEKMADIAVEAATDWMLLADLSSRFLAQTALSSVINLVEAIASADPLGQYGQRILELLLLGCHAENLVFVKAYFDANVAGQPTLYEIVYGVLSDGARRERVLDHFKASADYADPGSTPSFVLRDTEFADISTFPGYRTFVGALGKKAVFFSGSCTEHEVRKDVYRLTAEHNAGSDILVLPKVPGGTKRFEKISRYMRLFPEANFFFLSSPDNAAEANALLSEVAEFERCREGESVGLQAVLLFTADAKGAETKSMRTFAAASDSALQLALQCYLVGLMDTKGLGSVIDSATGELAAAASHCDGPFKDLPETWADKCAQMERDVKLANHAMQSNLKRSLSASTFSGDVRVPDDITAAIGTEPESLRHRCPDDSKSDNGGGSDGVDDSYDDDDDEADELTTSTL